MSAPVLPIATKPKPTGTHATPRSTTKTSAALYFAPSPGGHSAGRSSGSEDGIPRVLGQSADGLARIAHSFRPVLDRSAYIADPVRPKGIDHARREYTYHSTADGTDRRSDDGYRDQGADRRAGGHRSTETDAAGNDRLCGGLAVRDVVGDAGDGQRAARSQPPFARVRIGVLRRGGDVVRLVGGGTSEVEIAVDL